MEICRLLEKIFLSSMLMDLEVNGLYNFGLFVTLIEAAEGADSPDYLLWAYSNSPLLLFSVSSYLHPLFFNRLPRIYFHFADEDTKRFMAVMYEHI